MFEILLLGLNEYALQFSWQLNLVFLLVNSAAKVRKLESTMQSAGGEH